MVKAFSGFPPGQVNLVELPEPLFGDLVPLIDDLNELKVTLHCYWRLSRTPGDLRFVRRRDLAHDERLLAGLDPGTDPEGWPDRQVALDAALERATARGSLLHVHLERQPQTGDPIDEDWYFANTPKGRAAIRAIERGEWPGELDAPQRAAVQRPNIFVLYEQNIGVLQPLIVDELRQAEQEYPADWIQEAFQAAASANVRRWSYVRAILERWTSEGKADGTSGKDSEADRHRYARGKYADYVES